MFSNYLMASIMCLRQYSGCHSHSFVKLFQAVVQKLQILRLAIEIVNILVKNYLRLVRITCNSPIKLHNVNLPYLKWLNSNVLVKTTKLK